MKNSKLFILFLLLVFSGSLTAQNTIVTDDDSYTGNNSAVLDVYSKTKGLLVPRLTTTERQAIVSPADGLLVYDATLKTFYVYTNSSWNTVDAPSIWQTNSDSIYVNGTNKRYGVGTASPLAKLTVQGDATIAPDEPLFEVKNAAGDVIFAVYENEVKVNFKEGAKGVKGGFAVGGLSGVKAEPTEYLRITPDSTRIYINDAPAKGVKGGFAVGGLSGSKGRNEYFKLDDESASIYLKQPTKGVKGGFAVGGLSGSKVGANFLNLTPDNYFIGEGAGSAITTGLYNSFMGYQAGLLNSQGMQNIFIGYQAGLNNQFGNWNTFLGFEAGLSNIGSDNTFIGYKAGRVHTSQGGNVHIGSKAGEFATNGEQNIFIGESSGSYNTNGGQNIFMGYQSGFSNQTGNSNVFIGTSAVRNATGSSQNVAIGNNVAYNVTSTVSSSVIMGDNALTSMAANIPVTSSLFIGKNAGINLGDGSTTVSNCVFLGTNAGDGIKNTEYSSVSSIVALGNYSGNNADGYRNVFIGNGAGSEFVGHQNTMIGFLVGTQGSDGTFNVYIGDQAALQTSGSNNTYIGRTAGSWVIGSNNVFLGYNAGKASFSSPRTESNRLRIGESDIIYGEFDNEMLKFNANVGVNVDPSASYQLYVYSDDASSYNPSIYGRHVVTNGYGIGVQGEARYWGVYGYATSNTGAIRGVYGYANNTSTTDNSYGVYGYGRLGLTATGTSFGVYGYAYGGATRWAGYFNGNVRVTGTFDNAKSVTKIDHPDDPENKYLVHSRVNSPDMKNMYDGVVILDNTGKATVKLPDYFESYNKDFRYQLTAIGAPAPSIYIEKEINNNEFIIAGGKAGMKISWLVTGIRKDPYAEQHRTVVEQEKLDKHKGKYLNPEVYNKSEEEGIYYQEKDKTN